jgi:hypothetical protein
MVTRAETDQPMLVPQCSVGRRGGRHVTPGMGVKFHDNVGLPYEEGAEQYFEEQRIGPWNVLRRQFRVAGTPAHLAVPLPVRRDPISYRRWKDKEVGSLLTSCSSLPKSRSQQLAYPAIHHGRTVGPPLCRVSEGRVRPMPLSVLYSGRLGEELEGMC